MQKNKKDKIHYKAWSQLRRAYIYVWAPNETAAANLIRRRVQKAIGKYDSNYNVEEHTSLKNRKKV